MITKVCTNSWVWTWNLLLCPSLCHKLFASQSGFLSKSYFAPKPVEHTATWTTECQSQLQAGLATHGVGAWAAIQTALPTWVSSTLLRPVLRCVLWVVLPSNDVPTPPRSRWSAV